MKVTINKSCACALHACRVNEEPGHYTDALSKGHNVYLLATESSGALSPALVKMLRCLAKSTLDPDGHDSTPYGTGRASPKSFYPHHVAAISSAIVCADAHAISNKAASMAFELTHGL